jgi:DNA ligase-1
LKRDALMRDFARLHRDLGASADSSDKIATLADYFRGAEAADAAWALTLLCGSPPRRVMTTAQLRRVACEVAGVAEWLFDECRRVAGDMAETIALLIPQGSEGDTRRLSVWIEDELSTLARCDDRQQLGRLEAAWRRLDVDSRCVWNKLLTGGFRGSVPKGLVLRALAEAYGLPVSVLARRVSRGWTPDRAGFERLVAAVEEQQHSDRPHPFCLAHLWPGSPDQDSLSTDDIFVEWKWDGIRAQALRRSEHTSLWSRDEELLDDRFPEIVEALHGFPEGTALDGEIVPMRDGRPLPFARLEERIARKHVTRTVLEHTPAIFLAFDVLEDAGADIRSLPLIERRGRLERLFEDSSPGAVRLAELVHGRTWEQLDELRRGARGRGVEGLMLKRKDSPYTAGRVQGTWWKWKVDPLLVTAVLVYAQAGEGNRSELFADYSFAVWNNGELVPFAKASCGLTDSEAEEINTFVKQAAVKKFGPVRAVRPELVFEIAFEGLCRSDRHKSGFTVRSPRILRWRRDKTIADADTLERVLSLLPTPPSPPSQSGRARPSPMNPAPRQLRFEWRDSEP